MKKKTFGRRHTQSGFTHSESPAAQIDPATRERLIAELAEQARNGGAREKAEFERLLAEWLHERRQKYDPDYDGIGDGGIIGG